MRFPRQKISATLGDKAGAFFVYIVSTIMAFLQTYFCTDFFENIFSKILQKLLEMYCCRSLQTDIGTHLIPMMRLPYSIA